MPLILKISAARFFALAALIGCIVIAMRSPEDPVQKQKEEIFVEEEIDVIV